MTLLTSCDAELGKTHCFTTTIFPHENCENLGGQWDGSSIVVDGKEIDGEIQFTITNVGEDMEESLNFFIIEDDVLMRQEPFQLNAANGNQFTIPEDCDGKTYRLEAEQARFHPGNSNPSISVEGCSGNFTPGLVNLFAQDDEDFYKDITCINNIGSFDPNDKQGFPYGATEKRCVNPNRQIEYLIRFQNTGTAPAFNVIVTDVLDTYLDLSTFEIIGSSHDHKFELNQDRQLTFTFEDINLPDVESNEPASHGFIKYRILPVKDIPFGTEVYNEASIYFDFNEPIITNETRHTVDDACIETIIVNDISENNQVQMDMQVFPSPFTDHFTLRSSETESFSKEFNMNLYNTKGQLISTQQSTKGIVEYSNKALKSGVYFYELIDLNRNKLFQRGKVICIKD